jgi:glycine/D-amino acid oxidase-like deaminating enzyme
MATRYDIAIVGGGFFGAELAVRLGRRFPRILLLEREAELLTRASYHNQARVHNGYHYPRSFLTALRSRVNYPRFKSEYADCIADSFAKYYAVARKFSKVTAGQFHAFCRRIGAPCVPATGSIRRWFNFDLIEELFRVEECAFDACRLRARVWGKLNDAGVTVALQTTATRLAGRNGCLELIAAGPDGEAAFEAEHVFLCTYANLNGILRASGLPVIPLKQELTEMALVEVPEPLRSMGITVMCGPFFSCMPFPARALHSLSHVRYTPHDAWFDGPSDDVDVPARFAAATKQTHYPLMIRDSARYLPSLAESRYVDSLWEMKTVLPRNEADDGRPILFRPHHGLTNVHCVLGSKIDNIYDALDHIEGLFAGSGREVA